MKEREIKYFRIITQATGFKYLVEMFKLGDYFSNWNYLWISNSKDNIIAKISDYIVENNIDYRLISNSTSNIMIDVEKEIKRKMQTVTNKETTYFKITSVRSSDQNSLFLVEISKDLLNWKLIFKSEIDNYRLISDWVVSHIKANKLQYNYQIISDFNISFRINNDLYQDNNN